jgi:predicted dehydrogenase
MMTHIFLLRFDNGAKGILQNSQIANGEENDLNIRVYGETGGLQWKQMEPNTLIHKTNQGVRIIRTGVGNLSKAAQVHTRIPAGHPEGYFEAFANLYRNFAIHLRAYWEGRKPLIRYTIFPSAAGRSERHEVHRRRHRLGQNGDEMDRFLILNQS